MGNQKQVTILVAVLNKKETIRECIDSLLALKYPFEKIMIVDGGSTDGTYEILKGYGNKIYLRQFPNTGLSHRLNLALDNIQTEYTALTDADCVVASDWLDELLKGFDEKEVITTAGYCGTPKDVPLFQKIIGLELENRFKRLPQYLVRAPTMNLCLKTGIARKVKFDEQQLVDVETDFGFRLIKFGKMKYVPKALIWHYHRSSLKNYFRQQWEYARWGVRLLLKHKRRAVSDPITTLGMTIQIPLFLGVVFFLILSFFSDFFLYPAIIMSGAILLIYIKDIIEIKPVLILCPLLLLLFIFRTIAWSIGVLSGFDILFSEISIKSRFQNLKASS